MGLGTLEATGGDARKVGGLHHWPLGEFTSPSLFSCLEVRPHDHSGDSVQ